MTRDTEKYIGTPPSGFPWKLYGKNDGLGISWRSGPESVFCGRKIPKHKVAGRVIQHVFNHVKWGYDGDTTNTDHWLVVWDIYFPLSYFEGVVTTNQKGEGMRGWGDWGQKFAEVGLWTLVGWRKTCLKLQNLISEDCWIEDFLHEISFW